MTFQVGDKVIYPNHGLGIVERIEDKTHPGNDLRVLPSSDRRERHHRARARSPTSTASACARPSRTRKSSASSGCWATARSTITRTGKGRFKDNSDKMRTGSIYDMADVLKSLTFLSKSKSLSFREKRDARPRQGADHLGNVRSDARRRRSTSKIRSTARSRSASW